MPRDPHYSQGEKFVRVIDLLQELSQTKYGISTREFAERLGVDQRSAQRYIRQLREEVQLDIEEVSRGRYRLGDQSVLPPLQLRGPEAAVVLMALRLLQQMRPHRDPALVSALAKLAEVLKVPTVTSYLGAMVAATERRREAPERHAVERALIRGFVERLKVEIHYVDGAGKESRRVIHPYFLEPRPESRTIFVVAHDEKAKALRMFRMDRVAAAREILERFETPSDFDIESVTRSAWGIWQSSGRDRVVLRFAPEIAARVRQSTWHESATLTDLPGGGVEMRLSVASEVEMRPWVLGWGSLVEVVGPASLREHVAASMRSGAALYGSGR